MQTNLPEYQELKKLAELLDLTQRDIDQSKQLYLETLQQFATLCHQLWQQERAQGNHRGKGFRQSLQQVGINVNRAYRTMKKFFPVDFPEKEKEDQTS
jgi:hypothetical protein